MTKQSVALRQVQIYSSLFTRSGFIAYCDFLRARYKACNIYSGIYLVLGVVLSALLVAFGSVTIGYSFYMFSLYSVVVLFLGLIQLGIACDILQEIRFNRSPLTENKIFFYISILSFLLFSKNVETFYRNNFNDNVGMAKFILFITLYYSVKIINTKNANQSLKVSA